jgi:hypothetical protein
MALIKGAYGVIYVNLDKLLVALLLFIFLWVGLSRQDYAGDGLRHLDHILQSDLPTLGEPRWILFPVLLFAVVKPFVATGIVHSTAQAARVFCLFNVASGFIYLLCLRCFLSELTTIGRTSVLLLAGGSYAFLSLVTDIIEPTGAVSMAIAGITFGRFHHALSISTRVTIASASLALASLIYQGLAFGFFFLPAIFPFPFSAGRTYTLRVVALALMVPVVTIALTSFSAGTPQNAARRFIEGEGNRAMSLQYSHVSPKNLLGVMIIGPTYAFANIRQGRGLSGTIDLLRNPKTALQGVQSAVAWGFSAIAIVGALIFLALRKEFALLLAYAGMMTLPLLRMTQYGYMKYYVLMPFLAVLVTSRLKVRAVYVGALGTLLLMSNLNEISAQNAEVATLRLEVARELYPRIPSATCFLTNGWAPPIVDWPGDSVSWLDIVGSGTSGSEEENAKLSSELLRERLKRLFCNCPAILTDSFVLPNLGGLQQELSQFHIHSIPLSKVVVRAPESAQVFASHRYGVKFTVYRFSSEDQQRACKALE